MTQERNHKVGGLQSNDQDTYEFAMWEGWPSPHYATTMLINNVTDKINEREDHGRQEPHATHR